MWLVRLVWLVGLWRVVFRHRGGRGLVGVVLLHDVPDLVAFGFRQLKPGTKFPAKELSDIARQCDLMWRNFAIWATFLQFGKK